MTTGPKNEYGRAPLFDDIEIEGENYRIPVVRVEGESGGGGGATTVADGDDVAQGATTDPAWVSGAGSIISILKGLFGRIPGLGTATAANSLPVTIASNQATIPTQNIPTSGTSTDRSVTITTGGTAQQAAAALSTRKYLFIQNPSTNTGSAWFSTLTTAAAASPSIELPPGASYENPAHFCPTGAVSVIHPTTGAKLTVREL